MDDTDCLDATLDAALCEAAPRLSPEASAFAAALPGRLRHSAARRAKWGLGAALAGAMTLSGTAAVAVPLLLQPFPGYTEIVAFSYGVDAGQPGIRCQTIVAVKRLPDDGRYDDGLVTRFEHYLRSQRITIQVPEAARQPYTGGASSTSPMLYESPPVAELNRAYSNTMQEVYDRFDEIDAAATGQTIAQTESTFGHSAMLQDTVSCVGTP